MVLSTESIVLWSLYFICVVVSLHYSYKLYINSYDDNESPLMTFVLCFVPPINVMVFLIAIDRMFKGKMEKHRENIRKNKEEKNNKEKEYYEYKL